MSKNIRCTNCEKNISSDFVYCPYCRTYVKEIKLEPSFEAIEKILAEQITLTPAHINEFINILKIKAAEDPRTVHIYEEKIIDKYISNVIDGDMAMKEIILLGKQIQKLKRTVVYTKEY